MSSSLSTLRYLACVRRAAPLIIYILLYCSPDAGHAASSSRVWLHTGPGIGGEGIAGLFAGQSTAVAACQTDSELPGIYPSEFDFRCEDGFPCSSRVNASSLPLLSSGLNPWSSGCPIISSYPFVVSFPRSGCLQPMHALSINFEGLASMSGPKEKAYQVRAFVVRKL